MRENIPPALFKRQMKKSTNPLLAELQDMILEKYDTQSEENGDHVFIFRGMVRIYMHIDNLILHIVNLPPPEKSGESIFSVVCDINLCDSKFLEKFLNFLDECFGK